MHVRAMAPQCGSANPLLLATFTDLVHWPFSSLSYVSRHTLFVFTDVCHVFFRHTSWPGFRRTSHCSWHMPDLAVAKNCSDRAAASLCGINHHRILTYVSTACCHTSDSNLTNVTWRTILLPTSPPDVCQILLLRNTSQRRGSPAVPPVGTINQPRHYQRSEVPRSASAATH